MTYDELNALLEGVANEPTNDVLMLENFDKIRSYVKESIDKMAEMINELEKAKSDYDKLRESKVRDFFNKGDDEIVEEAIEEEIEEKSDEESEIQLEDLFEDDVEIDDEIKKEEEE